MLWILQRYVTRELLKVFGVALVVIILFVFFGFSLRAMHAGFDLFYIRKIIPYIFLQAFPYSLPFALLIAVIMVYGRFSGDNEILAIRSSGLNLHVVITPTIIVSVVLSLFCLAVNSSLLPASEMHLSELKREAVNLLKEKFKYSQSIHLRGWEIYTDRTDEDGMFCDVVVIKSSAKFVHEVYYAKKGRIEQDKDAIHLFLHDGSVCKYSYNKAREMKKFRFGQVHIVIPIGGGQGAGGGAASLSMGELDDLSLARLIAERRKLEKNIKEKGERLDNPAEVMKELARKRDKLDIRRNEYFYKRGLCMNQLKKLDAEVAEDQRRIREKDRQSKEIRVAVETARMQVKRLEDELAEKTKALERKRRELEEMLLKQSKEAESPAAEGKEKGEAVPAMRGEEQARIIEAERRRIGELRRSVERLTRELATAKSACAKNEQMLADVEDAISLLRHRLASAEEVRLELQKQVDLNNEMIRKISEERHRTEPRRPRAEDQEKSHRMFILIHRMLSFSFASFVFAVVGVPLGILARHGHFIVGLGMGLALVLVYYGMIFTGALFATWRYVPVPLAMWWADGGLLLLGSALLWRVMRK